MSTTTTETTPTTDRELVERIACWKQIARECRIAWRLQDAERAEARVALLEAQRGPLGK